MPMIKYLPYFLLFVFLQITGCSRDNKRKNQENEYRETEKALVGANRILVKKDRERILSYIRRKGLEMSESPSGLWYSIQRSGSKDSARTGMMATLSYQVSLLDGKLCYTSDSLGNKKFRIGQGGIEAGLEEGILLLNKGDRAKFIMPPHLAHGLPGDGDKIPARSIIIYDVKLLDLTP
jgi:FKBP-type peptidyl-prolyl cis-trans isomerase